MSKPQAVGMLPAPGPRAAGPGDAPSVPSLADAAAGRGHATAAGIVCGVAVAACLATLPVADTATPDMPGFLLIHQTALILAMATGAGVLFAQAWRGRSLALTLAAAGTLYTAVIVTLQLLSYPNVFGHAPVLGVGSVTTIWLWTFWHVGPPVCGLAYAAALHRHPAALSPNGRAGTMTVCTAAALLLACGGGVLSAAPPAWLPPQVTPGGDYSGMVRSGIGPAMELLTLLSLAALASFTMRARLGRGRTTVEIWLIAGLVLLVLDNLVTQAGPMRGSWGWTVGRILALVSAFAVLWAYVTEVDVLRRRAELAAAQRSRAETALLQAQKMEALGRLTGGIAHDFNNLLMVMTSGFDLIRRKPQDLQRVVTLAEAGLGAVDRGAAMTRQLLSFARSRPLEKERVNPNSLILGFGDLIERAGEEKGRLMLALDPHVFDIRIDVADFQAAVLNLVVNARDALPPMDGRIEVASRNAELDALAAEALWSADAAAGLYVVVSVQDNGAGMGADTLARAFEPFFTTKPMGRGTGLGLSQVYGFARDAGGFVNIRTRPGGGTLVELWLPRQPLEMEEESGAAPKLATAPRAGQGTVLAVEDDHAVLAIVTAQLADLGYRVIPARGAEEALDWLREDHEVDLLFSDVMMPGGMNGVQLADRARVLRPGLRVALTSGHLGDAMLGGAAWGEKGGGLAVLPKPYTQDRLAAFLHERIAAEA